MERDRQAAFRRPLLVLSILLFAVIAVWNLRNLGAILARPEPHRSLRLAVAMSSLSLGTVALGLLVRDLRGGWVPQGISLMPAWLVFGLDLLDSYFFTKNVSFLVTGLAAIGMGVTGLGLLVWAFRRRPAA